MLPLIFWPGEHFIINTYKCNLFSRSLSSVIYWSPVQPNNASTASSPDSFLSGYFKRQHCFCSYNIPHGGPGRSTFPRSHIKFFSKSRLRANALLATPLTCIVLFKTNFSNSPIFWESKYFRILSSVTTCVTGEIITSRQPPLREWRNSRQMVDKITVEMNMQAIVLISGSLEWDSSTCWVYLNPVPEPFDVLSHSYKPRERHGVPQVWLGSADSTLSRVRFRRSRRRGSCGKEAWSIKLTCSAATSSLGCSIVQERVKRAGLGCSNPAHSQERLVSPACFPRSPWPTSGSWALSPRTILPDKWAFVRLGPHGTSVIRGFMPTVWLMRNTCFCSGSWSLSQEYCLYKANPQ